ncbi:hypothetical protein PROFUN_15867 [Planoprotostelium fungivorum]|uniref:Uncharacterized protein n=1 Tax=Planoprotostelium fungivorum TaxID=1890364 RepID=A0A2P6MSM9_9EUKA|nr:hypothetical protein PROFUN_16154 [Planoprotostelium fungivorum]PRP75232.1 hypothetical protein PROFUN_15867 [Planoprotostelium fungivorum]
MKALGGGIPKLSLKNVHAEFSELADREREKNTGDGSIPIRPNALNLSSGQQTSRRGMDECPPMTSRSGLRSQTEVEESSLVQANSDLKKKLAVYSEVISTYENRCDLLEEEIRSLKLGVLI